MASSANGRGAWLLLILGVSCWLRIAVGFGLLEHPERAQRNDSAGYSSIAENLSNGNGYSADLAPPRTPAVGRTPVYSVFLGAVLSVGRDVKWIWLAQVALDLCTALLVYGIARRMVAGRFALLACACYGVGMSGAVATAFVMPEVLFTFLVTAFVYATLRAVDGIRRPFGERPRTSWLALAAALLAAAILCRPIGVALVPVVCLFLLFGARASRRRRAIDLLVVGVTLAALVGPWMYRNWEVTGHLTISTIGDYNLLAYNAAALLAAESGRLESDVRTELEATLQSEPGDWSWIPRARSQARSILLERWPRYLWLHARRSVLGVAPDLSGLLELQGVTRGNRDTMSVLRRDGVVAASRHYLDGVQGRRTLFLTLPWLVILGMVWAAALVGAIVGVIRKDPRIGFLSLWVVALLFAAGPASHPRFGVPIFPAVAILAGVGAAGSHRVRIARLRSREFDAPSRP